MTEPPFSGTEAGNSSQSYPPPPNNPPNYPPNYPPPLQYPMPNPMQEGYFDPAAPYGRHPITGEPLSDKSKLIGGLLQLLGVFGIVGIGRMYLGYVGLGIAQLVVGLLTCGIGAIVWGLIDAIMILTDKVRDPRGLPLRDGT